MSETRVYGAPSDLAGRWVRETDMTALRSENARLREALVECRRELWHCNHQLKAKGAHEGTSVTEALRDADALIATLAARDDGVIPGIQLHSGFGASVIVPNLDELWAEAERMAGRPIDPLAHDG